MQPTSSIPPLTTESPCHAIALLPVTIGSPVHPSERSAVRLPSLTTSPWVVRSDADARFNAFLPCRHNQKVHHHAHKSVDWPDAPSFAGRGAATGCLPHQRGRRPGHLGHRPRDHQHCRQGHTVSVTSLSDDTVMHPENDDGQGSQSKRPRSQEAQGRQKARSGERDIPPATACAVTADNEGK